MVNMTETISISVKLFPRIRRAPFSSPAPSRTENRTEPPIPNSVPKDDRSVTMGAHTPTPARASAPVTGIFPT